jgi:hypothetical protein
MAKELKKMVIHSLNTVIGSSNHDFSPRYMMARGKDRDPSAGTSARCVAPATDDCGGCPRGESVGGGGNAARTDATN